MVKRNTRAKETLPGTYSSGPRALYCLSHQPRSVAWLYFALIRGREKNGLALKEEPISPKSGGSLASVSFCSELFPVGVWREHTDGSAGGTG